MEEEVDVTGKLEEFMRLISCYDFRTEKIVINGRPLPKTTKYWFLERLHRLSSSGAVQLRHLSYLRPLGVRVAFTVKGDPVLSRKLLNINELDVKTAEDLGFPLPYLLNTIAVIGGGRVFVSWIIPPGVDYSPLLDWGDVVLGDKVPVFTCHERPGRGDVERLGSKLIELLGESMVKLRSPVLAYILLAVLDRYKLITFRDMARLDTILSSRGVDWDEGVSGELKWRYLRKYYYALSQRRVLGRVQVVPRDHLTYPRVTVIGGPECAVGIYGAAALKGYAGHIYYSDELVVANMLLDKDIEDVLMDMSRKCIIDVSVRYRTFGFPFPYELYDPIRNEWRTSPVEGFSRILKKLGLLERR